MLFNLKGVDAEGRKREISIDAVSEDDAHRRASEMGITATACFSLADIASASPDEEHPAKTPAVDVYPWIIAYAAIVKIAGWLTMAFSPILALIVMVQETNRAIPVVVFVASLIVGIGQLAFAELLGLLVRLQANTQFICSRLYAIDQQSKNNIESKPLAALDSIAPITVLVGNK